MHLGRKRELVGCLDFTEALVRRRCAFLLMRLLQHAALCAHGCVSTLHQRWRTGDAAADGARQPRTQKTLQGGREHTWWSPRMLLEPRRGTPRLDMTSVVPGCVPPGIFRSTCACESG